MTREEQIHGYLSSLQQNLCQSFGQLDGGKFVPDPWTREPSATGLTGCGISAVLEGGEILERAGVGFSDVGGASLPPSATARNPQLAGRRYRAMGVSVVMHPRNPHVPTSHMNVRFLSTGDTWWFGGGFDLTPYLVNEQDVIAWHRAAAAACEAFHPSLYDHLRKSCDEYFFVRHRGEARGIGGIFYDDLNEATPQFGMSWERCFEFMQAVAGRYCETYLQIVRARYQLPYAARERDFQLYRRGRYAEFNLVLDRGTLFGLQSGGRAESILMSMPPLVRWAYRSPDAELDARLLPYLTTLRGHDWRARAEV
ncbi:MAG TPA: oxygen-dependent coproporphyrinogen oxidase [Steroidobacteraceae bacterium]|jgi:coproporphyrinogen III oxidase|nr:oxygen-dependent coproporphyrinogen oxidase [Steroidobacteraceae bacterium]